MGKCLKGFCGWDGMCLLIELGIVVVVGKIGFFCLCENLLFSVLICVG